MYSNTKYFSWSLHVAKKQQFPSKTFTCSMTTKETLEKGVKYIES